ncbi:MAG: restriction endonuclease subunit S [Phycisphaeraceae bacterium]|nr:restriction endonuclease subunit S [Phycisphaeraceae bacterium]
MSTKATQFRDASPCRGKKAKAQAQDVRPGYKRTELGIIPESWEVVRLDERCVTYSGGTPDTSRPDFYGGEIPWITSGDLNAGRVREVAGRITKNGLNSSSAKMVRRGDLVLALYGATAGVVAITEIDAAINQAVLAIRTDVCDHEYLFQHLANRKTQIIDTYTQGGQPNLSGAIIRSLLIALPPHAEQRAIAEALSDVDGLLGALEALIAKKRAIKQAAMQQLLTGKTRLPGFSGEWESRQVRDVITRYFCGPSPTCEERNISGEEEWGVLKTTAATVENGWAWRQHKALPRAYWGREHQKVRVGDVIITKAGPRHRVGVSAWVDYVPDRIIVSGKMIGLRPHAQKAVPLVLAAALGSKHTQRFLDERTTGMAESQVNFENQNVLEAPLRLPPIDEQRAIATVLFDMDAEIAALETRRDKTRAIKQGMMQQLLTGRVRLVKPEAAA